MTTSPTSTPEWSRVLAQLRADALSSSRPAYAYCATIACVEAVHAGLDSIAVAEFGVGSGQGLVELDRICRLLTSATGVELDANGFDRGLGLPPADGYRDHPEIWTEGQFAFDRLDSLSDDLAPIIQLHVGDIAETLPPFVGALSADRPLGAVVIDVDLYSSTRDVLELFSLAGAEQLLPAVLMYVDDVDQLLTFNSRCGEALAIREFNLGHETRFVEAKRVRAGWPGQRWHEKIYVCHVLDHPIRTGARPPRFPFEISVDHL